MCLMSRPKAHITRHKIWGNLNYPGHACCGHDKLYGLRLLPDHNRVPQFEWRRYIDQRFPACAYANYQHRTKTKNTADESLLHFDGLDLCHIHLLRLAGNPTDLVDDPLVGNHNFRGRTDEPRMKK